MAESLSEGLLEQFEHGGERDSRVVPELEEPQEQLRRRWPRVLQISAAAACIGYCLLTLTLAGPGTDASTGEAQNLAADGLSRPTAGMSMPTAGMHRGVAELFVAEHQANRTSLKPVILMHGAAQSAANFDEVSRWILDSHPGTIILALEVYEGAASFKGLAEQVESISEILRVLTSENHGVFGDGYNLLCHSQGAVICRALCETMDDHKALTLVSLAGPHMGVYGKTWLKNVAPFVESQLPMPQLPIFSLPIPGLGLVQDLLCSRFYSVAYTESAQTSVSAANLWHDPTHQREYLDGNTFLPELNCEVGSEEERARRRSNFLRLKKAAFLVGSFRDRSYDSALGVEPWESGIFGFYAEGSESKMVPMEDQEVFIKDTFGLRTLKQTGRLHVEAVEGVGHQQWLTSRLLFERHVVSHLV